MDNSILLILGVISGTIILAAFISWMRKKGYVNSEDLNFVASLFSITIQIIEELNLQNEDKIKEIGEVVYDSLQFAAAIMDDDMTLEEVENYAYNYSIEVCESLEIEMTDQRRSIIRALIELGITNNVVRL